MIKLYNAETMRKDLIGQVRNIRVYRTGLEKPFAEESFIIKNERWQNSAAQEAIFAERGILLQRYKNAATGYDRDTIAALLGKNIIIDLQRLTDDMAVHTGTLFTEKNDPDITDPSYLRQFLPLIGKAEEVMGSGDTVPLMEHNLPVNTMIPLKLKAFGDKTMFRELVLNPFYKTQNIIESAARVMVDEQNKEAIAPIVTPTYPAAFTQDPDTTGATLDLKIYNTVKAAIKKAVRLWNIPTKKQNGLMAYKIYLLTNPMDAPDVLPILNGALRSLAGINQIVDALGIDGVIPYGGGLNDGMTWGKETLSYPGVEAGTFYIFVKNDVYGAYRIIKRNPTMEMGPGDPLELTTEKRAWHWIDGTFLDWILPTTDDGKNYGAVIKGTFPTS
jgi:hypothetical protein